MAAISEFGLTVRQCNGYYAVQCPAHDDRSPSLSVRGVAGKVLINCLAGCRTVDVAAVLKLSMADLFDEAKDSSKLPRSVVVAEYEYYDEHGQLLYVKERRFPKDFRIRRPDGHGKWIWKDVFAADGAPSKVLYRLPELLQAIRDDKRVYVVEGERDAENLISRGYVATTNVEGAAKADQRPKWLPAYGDSLKGADVVVVADRDDAGRAHARAIVADLDGKAARVTLVEPADGKDATDHLAAGHTIDDFQVIAGSVTKASATGWDEPLPCDWPTELPAWPDKVFPAAVEKWIDATAEETQTPKDLAGAAALGATSGAIGGRVKVQCPTWQEPTNTWVVPVLAPGSRKSAVIERAREPLAEAEAKLIEAKRDEILNAQTEREIREKAAEQAKTVASKDPTPASIKAAQDAVREAADVEVPGWPRLVTSDATPEKLGTILARHGGRISAISAEAGVFSSLTGRYTKMPNLDPMLQAHAGDTIIVDRQSRDPEHVKDPALTVLVSIQPFAMREMVARPDFAGRGLLARVLWCLPADIVGKRKVRGVTPMPSEVARAYNDLIVTLATKLAEQEVVTLSLSEDASEALLDFAERVERLLLPEEELGSARLTREWGSKLVGAVARIAGCLHAAQGMEALTQEISGSTMRAAIRLGNYFKAHAVAAMAPVDAGKASTTRYVLDKLVEKELYDFTIRELHRKVQKKFPTAAEVRQIVTELTDLGWVRAGGKEYELHPDTKTLLSRFDAAKAGDTGDTGDNPASVHVREPAPTNPAVTPSGDTDDSAPRANGPVTRVTSQGDGAFGGNGTPDLHERAVVTLVTPVTRNLGLANADDEIGEWSA